MNPDFYSLEAEVQFNLAILKLNKYLPQAIQKASHGKLSNTLNRRCGKWASRLARGVFSLQPDLREPLI